VVLAEATHREWEELPVGRYASTASCVVWCASPSLTGWHIWGRPDENETEVLLRLMSAYPKIGTPFSVVADTRGVELVNPTALPLLVSWVLQNRRELRRRVRLQANVIQRDAIGFLLLGIIASVAGAHPLRTFTEPREAFRAVASDDALCDEVEAIVARVRGVPHELLTLRSMLSADVDTHIRDAARALSLSTRSLQRMLERNGTSYRDEQTVARFARAQSLLRGGDRKISSVAARVGWSTRTLTTVFRAKTGLTPADWRKRETVTR
jgi:AraC-like DNA-binding protein